MSRTASPTALDAAFRLTPSRRNLHPTTPLTVDVLPADCPAVVSTTDSVCLAPAACPPRRGSSSPDPVPAPGIALLPAFAFHFSAAAAHESTASGRWPGHFSCLLLHRSPALSRSGRTTSGAAVSGPLTQLHHHSIPSRPRPRAAQTSLFALRHSSHLPPRQRLTNTTRVFFRFLELPLAPFALFGYS